MLRAAVAATSRTAPGCVVASPRSCCTSTMVLMDAAVGMGSVWVCSNLASCKIAAFSRACASLSFARAVFGLRDELQQRRELLRLWNDVLPSFSLLQRLLCSIACREKNEL